MIDYDPYDDGYMFMCDDTDKVFDAKTAGKIAAAKNGLRVDCHNILLNTRNMIENDAIDYLYAEMLGMYQKGHREGKAQTIASVTAHFENAMKGVDKCQTTK